VTKPWPKVAREALRIELDMEHRESIHTISVTELRAALEPTSSG
jgi:hypothetical protein